MPVSFTEKDTVFLFLTLIFIDVLNNKGLLNYIDLPRVTEVVSNGAWVKTQIYRYINQIHELLNFSWVNYHLWASKMKITIYSLYGFYEKLLR